MKSSRTRTNNKVNFKLTLKFYSQIKHQKEVYEYLAC